MILKHFCQCDVQLLGRGIAAESYFELRGGGDLNSYSLRDRAWCDLNSLSTPVCAPTSGK